MLLAQAATCDLSADSLLWIAFAVSALNRSVSIGVPVWTAVFALRVVRRIAKA